MCGRYIKLIDNEKIKKIFDINSDNFCKNIKSYNIAPSQNAIIITNEKFFKIEEAKWGIKFLKNNKIINIINSRIESMQNSFLFSQSSYKKRCIIVSNGYFEWKSINNIKIPYLINIPEIEVMYFAGIWKNFHFNNKTFKSFSILTKPVNNFLCNIHDRMPILFSISEAINYLHDDQILKRNFFSENEKYLDFFKVSKYVNNPSNNSIECINSII